ncbi:MAG: MlaD family protein [Sulfuricaulis sp.]|uniref:MlaD family protein n=1 Tax=Sulfuricaulis sp. TaxID=2003553 RepID=UPI0034A52377
MAILQNEDPRFKGLEKKIGLFVLVAILGVVLTVVSIGYQHDIFSPKIHLNFITESGQDINDGMAVKLSGFNIGKVEKLELTDAAKVKVTLAINKKYLKWVRTDSKARLLKEGLIGANVIEISPGTETAAALTDNTQIAFKRERGLGQVVDELYAEIVPLIEDLKRVAQRAETLLAGLPATQQKLDAVLVSAKNNFDNLEKITASDVPATLRKLDAAILSATRALDNLEKVTASDLPAITKRGREAVEGAKKIVDSVSRTWPISGAIEAPKSETLPVDSYTEGQNQKKK